MANFKQQNSFPLRMPDELRKQLEERAKAMGRSVNAEIVMILQQALGANDADLAGIPSGKLLLEVIARYHDDLKIEIGGTAAHDVVEAAKAQKS